MRKTRTIYLASLFLFLATTALSGSVAPKAPFEKCDFDSGEYVLYGLPRENNAHELVKALGSFYTDDTKVLNQFKKEWVFKEESPMYACGYHYSIYLVRNHKTEQTLSINLECEEIVLENGSYRFDPGKLGAFKGMLKPLKRESQSFSTMKEARDYWNKVKDKPGLFTPDEEIPDWVDYEGKFEFTCLLPSTKEYVDDEVRLQPIYKKIREKFKNLNFTLRITSYTAQSKSPDVCEVEIKCGHALYQSFTLFKITEQWRPFNQPFLTLYRHGGVKTGRSFLRTIAGFLEL